MYGVVQKSCRGCSLYSWCTPNLLLSNIYPWKYFISKSLVTLTCELFVISTCKCTVCVNKWCAMYNLICYTILFQLNWIFVSEDHWSGLETNVLIHWPTCTGQWIVRFYNSKQRATSRLPHFSDFFTETNNKPHCSDASSSVMLFSSC